MASSSGLDFNFGNVLRRRREQLEAQMRAAKGSPPELVILTETAATAKDLKTRTLEELEDTVKPSIELMKHNTRKRKSQLDKETMDIENEGELLERRKMHNAAELAHLAKQVSAIEILEESLQGIPNKYWSHVMQLIKSLISMGEDEYKILVSALRTPQHPESDR